MALRGRGKEKTERAVETILPPGDMQLWQAVGLFAEVYRYTAAARAALRKQRNARIALL